MEENEIYNMNAKKVLVTGSAGFIGFHLCQLLLDQGFAVLGTDGLTDYYDVSLKHTRNSMLLGRNKFEFFECMLEDSESLRAKAREFDPDFIVHLAAQAGVRYSIENPKSYVDSNLIGSFHVLEIARELRVEHLLMASTSSVYGANEDMPFTEGQKSDHQMSFYAATKKSNEVMAHSYSHIFGIPITMFRFFTVYGPWGRPDMALFKFTKAIVEGKPIDVYNNGKMKRDFTYVKDLVEAIRLLFDAIPSLEDKAKYKNDTLSLVAPHRIVNIGNAEPVELLDFILEIENSVGKQAIKKYLPMQAGDVAATWADTSLLSQLIGFSPKTPVEIGVKNFVDWYSSHYEF